MVAVDPQRNARAPAHRSSQCQPLSAWHDPDLGDPGGEHCRLSIIVLGSDGAQSAHKPANCLLSLCGLLCTSSSCLQQTCVPCCYWQDTWLICYGKAALLAKQGLSVKRSSSWWDSVHGDSITRLPPGRGVTRVLSSICLQSQNLPALLAPFVVCFSFSLSFFSTRCATSAHTWQSCVQQVCAVQPLEFGELPVNFQARIHCREKKRTVFPNSTGGRYPTGS